MVTPVILVAYATKYGSTGEVANAIAAILSQHGVEIEVHPVWDVRSLDGYSAVVIGAPLFMGRWHGEARRFVRRFRKKLANIPLAIFALGPLSTEEQDRQASTAQFERALAKWYWLTPRAIAVFGGVVDPSRLRFPFNRMPKRDARDWEAIRTWANWLVPAFQLQQQERGQQTLVAR